MNTQQYPFIDGIIEAPLPVGWQNLNIDSLCKKLPSSMDELKAWASRSTTFSSTSIYPSLKENTHARWIKDVTNETYKTKSGTHIVSTYPNNEVDLGHNSWIVTRSASFEVGLGHNSWIMPMSSSLEVGLGHNSWIVPILLSRKVSLGQNSWIILRSPSLDINLSHNS
ncbi:hypothetical protein CR513_40880, partial [Mucuna pruriens]